MPSSKRNRRHDIAREIALRLVDEPLPSVHSISKEFDIGNGAAYLAIDRANVFYSQWLLSHFSRPARSKTHE
jgi:hypothetical protein